MARTITIRTPQAALSCSQEAETGLIGSGTESDPFRLAADRWVNESLSSSNKEDWFSFNVTGGNTYYIWWNSWREGDESKTADVLVTINGSGRDNGWKSPLLYTADKNETVKIKVSPYNDSSGGTYGIVYSVGNTRP